MCNYQGVILFIGSLWWDQSEKRGNWRNNRLAGEKAQVVFAPIRYGRKSESRNYTYTMVLSPSCQAGKMGTAIIVPLRHQTKNSVDLIQEAQCLWKVEGGLENRVAGTWGAVGLLLNPKKNIEKTLIEDWKDFYQSQPNKPTYDEDLDKMVPISNEGMLNIAWINDIHNQPLGFDFVLTTATVPNVKPYPTSTKIAEAFLGNNYFEYFRKNREHGITTYQDEEIEALLEGR